MQSTQMSKSGFYAIFRKYCNTAAGAEVACINCVNDFVHQRIELWPGERCAPIANTYIGWV
jgi:hypothetical protein